MELPGQTKVALKRGPAELAQGKNQMGHRISSIRIQKPANSNQKKSSETFIHDRGCECEWLENKTDCKQIGNTGVSSPPKCMLSLSNEWQVIPPKKTTEVPILVQVKENF